MMIVSLVYLLVCWFASILVLNGCGREQNTRGNEDDEYFTTTVSEGSIQI